jgi:serine-type D-Ala-D-Ala carboxypeptidase/endopeptidase (penicillin-binding protein 4)
LRIVPSGVSLAAFALAVSIQPSPAASQAAGATKAEPPSAPAPATGAAGTAEPGAEPAAAADPAAEGEEGGSAGTGHTVTAPPEDAAERVRWLARELDAALAARPALAGAKLGAHVVELTSGATLWQHRGEEAMSLASNAKLFTAATALTALGPGYVWRTALYGGEASGEDATEEELRDGVIETLYLRGRGDPTLEYGALRALARDLADRGVKKVTKEIVLDATFFDGDTEPPHFAEQPKERAAFRAPVSALSLNRNSVIVVVTTDPNGDGSPTVRLDPPVPDVFKLITDELVTTVDGKTRIRVEVVQKRKETELRVSGQLRADGPGFYRRVRIDDPIAFTGAALKAALTEHGIRVPTKLTAGAVPETGVRLFAAFDSPPLAEVVRRMNKTSDNFLAESIYKTVGAETRAVPGPGTWGDAAAAGRVFLDKLALPQPIRIDNGSGLFDATSASASQLVALLRESHRDFRIAPDFIASLPVAGVDGTLQSRFRKRTALGLARAKTGTLAAVSTLGGFVGVDSARLVAFAVLVNDLAPAQKGEARALQEDLIDILALYTGALPPLGAAASAPPAMKE